MRPIETAQAAYSFDLGPVLVLADSSAAEARAIETAGRSGLRYVSSSLAEAAVRVRMQARASTIWVELDDDPGSEVLLPLISQLRTEVDEGRSGAVLAIPEAMIDPCVASVGDSRIELLVDADATERCAALAIATSGVHRAAHLFDSASDQGADRLRRLSDEVGRIASTLARLSTESVPSSVARAPVRDLPEVSVETVRSVIKARRVRSQYFPDELFADPAWDMLLDLFQAELAQLRVPVSSLCIAAAVPATTALRWLKTMTANGLFVRRADPHDGRRVFVELSPSASASLRGYFSRIGQAVVV